MSNGVTSMSGYGYEHASEAGSECGRFPAASRPSTAGVSFLPDFVGFTPDSGPTVRGLQTAARDPKLTAGAISFAAIRCTQNQELACMPCLDENGGSRVEPPLLSVSKQ